MGELRSLVVQDSVGQGWGNLRFIFLVFSAEKNLIIMTQNTTCARAKGHVDTLDILGLVGRGPRDLGARGKLPRWRLVCLSPGGHSY